MPNWPSEETVVLASSLKTPAGNRGGPPNGFPSHTQLGKDVPNLFIGRQSRPRNPLLCRTAGWPDGLCQANRRVISVCDETTAYVYECADSSTYTHTHTSWRNRLFRSTDVPMTVSEGYRHVHVRRTTLHRQYRGSGLGTKHPTYRQGYP